MVGADWQTERTPRVIVATAGHVDHGKTSLVKRLTGINTDTLKEEKLRGLSINLGYAFLRADADATIGFIDVPGHSRFINTMIAGVGGIDMALVVVAADEGPMPQTLEHLEVLRLLGIRQYVLVISHIDRIESARIKSVSEKVHAALGLQCPIFEVNNIDGAGIDNLKNYLLQTARRREARAEMGYFRLSIDRSFLLTGIGLVVTGTAISGRVTEGDKLYLQPDNREVRVRAIHAQNEKSATGRVGQRCALQLAGIDKIQVKRGDWLHARADTQISNRLNVRLEMSGGLTFKVKHLCPVKVYIGAKLTRAKLYLLERYLGGGELQAGNSVLAQLIIDGSVNCCRGDRLILRDNSESVTLGGAIVLDPHAVYSPKLSQPAKNYLLAMEASTLEGVLRRLLIDQQRVVNLRLFKQMCNLRDADLDAVLQQGDFFEETKAFSFRGHDYLVASHAWTIAEQSIVTYLRDWHADNPSMDGIQASYLWVCLVPEIDQNLYDSVLDHLLEKAVMRRANGCLKLQEFTAQSSAIEQQQWQLIERTLSTYTNQIPTLANLQDDLQLDGVSLHAQLQRAVTDRRAFRLGTKRFILFTQLSLFAYAVCELAEATPRFSVVETKNHLGLGRNSCIQLLEYFDHIGLTRREGEGRMVIDKELPDRLFSMS